MMISPKWEILYIVFDFTIKYYMISLMCEILKAKQLNKKNRNRFIDTENKLLVVRWEDE